MAIKDLIAKLQEKSEKEYDRKRHINNEYNAGYNGAWGALENYYKAAIDDAMKDDERTYNRDCLCGAIWGLRAAGFISGEEREQLHTELSAMTASIYGDFDD